MKTGMCYVYTVLFFIKQQMLIFFFFLKMCLFILERESTQVGGAEGEGESQSDSAMSLTP